MIGTCGRVGLGLVLAVMTGTSALADGGAVDGNGGPGVITGGEVNVLIDGMPAATVGDPTSAGGVVTGGSSNVFINGRPVVTVGSPTECGGVVVGGASGVFINGRPVAGTGSATSPCPGQ